MVTRGIRRIAVLVAVGMLPACGVPGSGTQTDSTSVSAGAGDASTAGGAWTWMGGSDHVGAPGIDGMRGTPSESNVPGARSGSASCRGAGGDFWLFGGAGLGASGGGGWLNDLWKFDGSRWTWMSGSSSSGATGVYGVQGSPAASNTPGARSNAVLGSDPEGNLWLFGGEGVSGGQVVALDDLWRFDGSQWTWIAGNSTPGAAASRGTPGVASSSNTPGARFGMASWVDASGALWIFGGQTVAGDGSQPTFGDLWKHDGSGWAWMSGSSAPDQAGNYGTPGVASPTNYPGSRSSATACADPAGNVWLFGGNGFDSTGSTALWLNDLWKFDGTVWTWMAGGKTAMNVATYGSPGVAAAGNTPGARSGSALWSDDAGGLWLFGGTGFGNQVGSSSIPGESYVGNLNDLWRFKGTEWAWRGGSNDADQPGVYGTRGTSSAQNVPGGRTPSAFWKDSAGDLWIFGGIGQDGSDQNGTLNDLWRYSP